MLKNKLLPGGCSRLKCNSRKSSATNDGSNSPWNKICIHGIKIQMSQGQKQKVHIQPVITAVSWGHLVRCFRYSFHRNTTGTLWTLEVAKVSSLYHKLITEVSSDERRQQSLLAKLQMLQLSSAKSAATEWCQPCLLRRTSLHTW